MRIDTTSEKVTAAMDAIRAAGGRVSRDNGCGRIEVKGVSASFNFNEDMGVLDISITDTPWYASTGMVEDEINAFFK